MNEINKKRFHYSQSMESADWEYFGIQNRPSGYASAYNNYKNFKSGCRKYIKRIKNRINKTVTSDICLKETLLSDLKFIDDQVKIISEDRYSEIDIIGDLFKLIAHLLGWDLKDGKFYRTPVFYQTKKQEEELYKNISRAPMPQGLFEDFHKHKLIKELRKEGKSYTQIALIFNISAKRVEFYERAAHLSEMYQSFYNG